MNDYQSDFANDLSSTGYGQREPQKKLIQPQLTLVSAHTDPAAGLLLCGGGAVICLASARCLTCRLQGQRYWPSRMLKCRTWFADRIARRVHGLVNMMQSGGEFNFNQVNSQATMDATVPLTGPNGTAMLHVEAESSDGGVTWNYTVQEVVLPDGSVIDLLPPGSTTPTPATPQPTPDSGREIPDQE